MQLERPELDTPRPKLLRALTWRQAGPDDVEVISPEGRAVREKPWAGDVLDALAAGESYGDMLARFAKRHPEEEKARWADYLVRRYLLKLERWGVVDLGLGADPASFRDGRYRTLARLGQGGFGVVWRARDERSGADVVVKRASTYYHALPLANASLEAEARVLAACDHRGVARFLERFEEEGRVHLARECVDGHDVARARGGKHDVASDIIQVASIVGHLHERGYLMLDLGPANFLRRDVDGRIVVTDVGLCVPREGEVVRLEHKAGSPGFASPEIRIERVASVRSDVWSLGALAFALTLGLAPHEKWREPQYAERLGSAPLKDAILRLMATDPAQRPASMAEAAALVEAARRG